MSPRVAPLTDKNSRSKKQNDDMDPRKTVCTSPAKSFALAKYMWKCSVWSGGRSTVRDVKPDHRGVVLGKHSSEDKGSSHTMTSADRRRINLTHLAKFHFTDRDRDGHPFQRRRRRVVPFIREQYVQAK